MKLQSPPSNFLRNSMSHGVQMHTWRCRWPSGDKSSSNICSSLVRLRRRLSRRFPPSISTSVSLSLVRRATRHSSYADWSRRKLPLSLGIPLDDATRNKSTFSFAVTRENMRHFQPSAARWIQLFPASYISFGNREHTFFLGLTLRIASFAWYNSKIFVVYRRDVSSQLSQAAAVYRSV